MSCQTPLVVYGGSGHARAFGEVVAYGLGIPSKFKIVAYIDDERGDAGHDIDGVPIIRFETWRGNFLSFPCVVVVGDPAQRESLVLKMSAAGGKFATLCQIRWPISPSITVGEGSVIAPPVYIGPLTSIGKHVHIMPMTTIGHDCSIGDFVTLCPSISISGNVVIEAGVFIGVGAKIVNGASSRPLRIGTGAKIFAGAVVMKSVRPGAKVAGNPARELRSLIAQKKT